MSFSNLDIAVMAKLVDVDKMEAEAAAAKWMKDNEKKWKPWVNAARTQGPSRGPKPQNGPSEMADNFFSAARKTAPKAGRRGEFGAGKLGRMTGFEPATPWTTTRCSNQLSYIRRRGAPGGLPPAGAGSRMYASGHIGSRRPVAVCRSAGRGNRPSIPRLQW